MVIGRRGRSAQEVVFGPLARALVRAGVSPDAVTIVGTIATITVAFTLVATGHLVAGPLLLGLVLFADSIDGLMARHSGRNSSWGAFLDSVMDRFGDAAVFSALAIYGLSLGGSLGAWTAGFGFALVPLALIVSYARARAESLGVQASVGIAERTDRLLFTLFPALFVGLGAPAWVLTAGLGYAAFASLITIIQRMIAVYRQAGAGANVV